MTYNYEALEKVYESVKSNNYQNFAMGFYDCETEDCKTVRCIAGWTCALFDNNYPTVSVDREEYDYDIKASEILNISSYEAIIFFHTTNSCALFILDNLVKDKNSSIYDAYKSYRREQK